jgi:hypothetical protein
MVCLKTRNLDAKIYVLGLQDFYVNFRIYVLGLQDFYVNFRIYVLSLQDFYVKKYIPCFCFFLKIRLNQNGRARFSTNIYVTKILNTPK